MIRASGLDGFRRLLFSWGIDPQPILARAGLTNRMLDTPDQMIDARVYRRTLNLAAQASKRRDFSLQLSQMQSFDKLGAVGFLARHAPTFQVAIDRMIRFLQTFDRGSVMHFEVDGDTALWTHDLVGVGDESPVQHRELAVSLACSFIQSAISESWTPTCVLFEHVAPADMTPFNSVFRCPIYFEQTLNGIEFPASDLKKPLRRADPGLFAILDQHVGSVHDMTQLSLRSRVRHYVQDNIETGAVRIDNAVSHLEIKRHILQRDLRQEGTTFQKIVDDVRFDLGCRYLRDTSMRVGDIASALGYAETAVFTRAFTRRSGKTPNAWRRENR